MKAIIIHADSEVAQWLACWAHNPKVRGSKPRFAMRILHMFIAIYINAWLHTVELHRGVVVSVIAVEPKGQLY